MIKSILLTGSTGFLGRSILENLSSFIVMSLGRQQSNDLVADLSTGIPIIKPEVDLVIHCAGKAHMVPRNTKENQSFFDINVKGTENLLKGIEQSGTLPKSFIFISSVAVYGRETGNMITEEYDLLAKDPYGLSKVQAEDLIISWCTKHNVLGTILRLPLIAGINPPGNLGAMIKGIYNGYYFDIAGGKARKSIVLAKDVAAIIPKVAMIGGIYNLTDRKHPNFSELSLVIASQLGKSKPLNIPTWIARIIAKIGDFLGCYAPINSAKLTKITEDLTFDDQKAVNMFGWNPTPVLEEFKIN